LAKCCSTCNLRNPTDGPLLGSGAMSLMTSAFPTHPIEAAAGHPQLTGDLCRSQALGPPFPDSVRLRGITLTGPRDDPIWLNLLDFCERPASPATKVNIPQHGIGHCLKLQCCSGLPGAQRRAGPRGIDPAGFSGKPRRLRLTLRVDRLVGRKGNFWSRRDRSGSNARSLAFSPG